MGDEKFLLTLEVAGRRYPLKIKRSDEQAFRTAAKQIDIKVNQYRVEFGNNPKLTTQDFVAMTAIQALAENFSLGDKNNTKPYEDKIDSLISELDDYLRK
mgnify:CR=1 FL=1